MMLATSPGGRPGTDDHARQEDDPGQVASGSARGFFVFFLVMMTLVLAVSLYTLTTFPTIHTDEPWYANLAQNWLATGNRWTTLDIGPFPDGRGQGTSILGAALPTRIAIQLGGLNLRAIRLPSLLAGIALLAVVAATGHLLWPGRSGPLAALVLALQPLFLYGSHMVRPEIWVALLALMALGCSLLGWKRNQPLWDVCAALVTVVSLDIHPNAAVFAAGLAASYLARYGRTVWRQRNALAFAAIVFTGAAYYLFRRYGLWLTAPAPAGGRMPGIQGSHPIPILSRNPLHWILNEVVRYTSYFGHDQMGALLLGFAVAAAIRRRSQTDRLLLAWLLGSALGLMLLVSRSFELYLLPMVSVGALLVGNGMDRLLQHKDKWGRRAVLFTILVLMLPLLLMLPGASSDNDKVLQRELQESVPCARILGPNQYWLAFSDCEYRSFDLVSHYHHLHGLSVAEAMTEVQPDYLIMDATVEAKLQEDFRAGGDMMGYYALPQDDVERFLDDRTTLTRVLTVPGYGPIQIRQVHWGAEK
ncbi:ArnT family glycosyltransferase [Chloroflexota bacterium]